MSEIKQSAYDYIRSVMPILCVDILIKRGNEVLLVKRNNEPLKGRFFIPGGRIIKGERAYGAARRKIKSELGFTPTNLKFIGYYEDVYNIKGGTVATTSIVFEYEYKGEEIKLGEESSEWKFGKLPARCKIKND